MIEAILSALPWVLPPVLGAVIGYITNAIAIRMLFRPFREVRVAGVRLPFTPGIIPRQRYQFADNIGDMVSKELLTEDAVRAQIDTPGFRDGLQRSVSSLTEKLFTYTAGDLLDAVGSSLTPEDSDRAGIASAVKDLLSDFVRSDSFARLVKSLTDRGIRRIASYSLADILPAGKSRNDFLDKIVDLIAAEESRDRVADLADSWLVRHVEDNTKVAEFLPITAIDQICRGIEVAFGPVTRLLLRWLDRDDMKRQLEIRGRYLLRDVLDKLTALQKIIITASQYDRTLSENMHLIVEDALESVAATLKDPNTKESLVASVRQELLAIRELGMAEAGVKFDLDLRDRVRGIVAGVYELTGSEETSRAIRGGLHGLFDKFETKTVEEVLSAVLGVEDIPGYLSDFAVARLRLSADGVSESALRFLKSLFEDSPGVPVGRALGITEKSKEHLDDRIVASVIDLIRTRVPEIVASIDINGLVVSKVNGLRIEAVEGLLMRVIHRHLKWINVFGGILGFLIGLTQILMRLIL